MITPQIFRNTPVVESVHERSCVLDDKSNIGYYICTCTTVTCENVTSSLTIIIVENSYVCKHVTARLGTTQPRNTASVSK